MATAYQSTFNENVFNFFDENINWDVINETLKLHDWVSEFEGLQPCEKFDRFISICYQLCEKFVPKRKLSKRGKRRRLPRERRILIRRRSKIHKRLQRTTNKVKQIKLRDELVSIERKLQDSYKDTSSEEEEKAVKAIKRNRKYFFTYARKFNKVRAKVGPLLGINKEYVAGSKEMADLLQDQYQSVFSTPTELCDADVMFPDEQSGLYDIQFGDKDFIEAISEISESSAAGPYGFSALFLNKTKDIIATPISMLWRSCLDNGVTPDMLKRSFIVPIHKGGSRGVPANYRPVSLTSHLVKIFEKIMRKHIVAYMEERDLFNCSQHGFRGGRSCLSQLLAHFDKILGCLEEGKNVDTIYLDFSKAFDKVDHRILMQKLKAIGIGGKVGRWIYSFLTGREQIVIVNGVHSKPGPVLSGVPQGSVLGPLLFLIMMTDIDENIIYAFISSFADDTRVSKEIKELLDTFKLQRDLNVVYHWSSKNNMEFNNCKFEHMKYGKDKEVKEYSCYLADNGKAIGTKEHVKDLGVMMSSDCTFTHHIQKTVGTAEELSGWILRSFSSRSKELMLTLWKSMILPHLDYCCQLWSPHKKTEIQYIEMTQIAFIRKIQGMCQFSYWDQLKKLNLYSLERRRERYIIMYVWCMLEKLVPNFGEHNTGGIQAKEHVRHGRRCVVKIVRRGPYESIISGSLPVNGAKLFNAMPRSLRNLSGCTKEIFKTKLDKILKEIPDEPQIRTYTSRRRADSNSILDMIKLSSIGLYELDM